ncbi:hypothetical protein [Mycolicibacterium pallens]|uniref:Uncharacterized protein n=1 Tax=Mycolicibacterium pallens TaxID=370524 RepID=A0ABX8VK94_9MYCO|nr:hypothetical protein [Mycolicibacterium pallens]QYL17967.1 hypothetical protein K0O64_05285 [Mycolicibacterium pallens]
MVELSAKEIALGGVDDFAVVALRAGPAGLFATLRALFALPGVVDFDVEVFEVELAEEWAPDDDPVSAEATAAADTMAAPTPSVTAPAFNHSRVLCVRCAFTPSIGSVSRARVAIDQPPTRKLLTPLPGRMLAGKSGA